jgi:hypothetical protein
LESDDVISAGKNRLSLFLIVSAAVGVLALQLPWLSRPPYDAHAFRQAQTLSTIELFAREGIDLAHAKANYVGEPGFFVLEFPLFQAVCALLYDWFGAHVWIVRLLNLIIGFGNAGLTFSIGKRLFGREAGLAAVLLYLFAPLNSTYLTSTLIDPSGILFSLAAFLCALRIVHPSETRPAGAGVWSAFASACLLAALIKPLYLFPTCVLLGGTLLTERRLSGPIVGSVACVGVSIGVFLLWLRHGQAVNNAFYFTRGISATTVVGFQPLATMTFYDQMARRIAFHLAGPGGAILAAFAAFTNLRHGRTRAPFPFFIAILSVSIFGYLLLFPIANQHDYYALVLSPYACVLGGLGAVEMFRWAATIHPHTAWFSKPAFPALAAVALSLCVFLKPSIVSKQHRIAPNWYFQELDRLSKGRFEPYSFGMVFVAPDPKLPMPTNLGSDVPQALYATRLRGTARLVTNSDSALAIWNTVAPHYQQLKYVVFYGVRPPPEIVKASREVIASDDVRQWFAYRLR